MTNQRLPPPLQLIVALTLTISKEAAESINARTAHQELAFCRSWIRKICRKVGIFPTSLILKDVAQERNATAVKCGGFADIYKGSYKGVPVALKVPRTDGTVGQTKKMHEVMRCDMSIC